MKRSAHTANSSSVDSSNQSHSPKRSCTEKNPKNNTISHSTAASASSIENISCSTVSSSTSTDMTSIESNIDTLVSMGFTDREINRRVLRQAENDISEAVTLLTGPNFIPDDLMIPAEPPVSTFIGPLTKEQIEQQKMNPNQQYNTLLTASADEFNAQNSNSFTTNSFLDLETKVYGDNWSIPYKQDEALGRCLKSATNLALAGNADKDDHCRKFMEILIPDAFRKLQTSHYVNNWAIEVQRGVFEMVELLIDLIAARLSYSPIPMQLLETLSILFDHESTFHRKHKNKYTDGSNEKQLGDRVLAYQPSTPQTSSSYNRNDPYGWLCQIINRFVLRDGIVNLIKQFQSEQPLNAAEYNALLAPFVGCIEFIHKTKFQELFNDHFEQALNYVQNLKEDDFKAKSTHSVFDLLTTLRKLCVAIWYNRVQEVEALHLNMLLQMIALPNFNAKMNSCKELAKIIDSSTSTINSNSKTSISRDVVSDWIIRNSVLSKALEGNIDQNQYVDKVRTLIDFIAPRILKEDIETIWRMQHGRSLVAVDHLFSLIAAAAAKFNLEQLNHLIALIYNSWKNETILIQEKLVELLGAIGRDCQKDSVARVLEVLWNMAHEERLRRSMLDHILHCHLRVFSEGHSTSDNLKREYCLKCMEDLKLKQGWLVPAIKHLNELLRHDLNNTFKRSDQDLVTILVNQHDLISALIQSLSTCQHNVWKSTQGHVTIDTLVDGRFTHEESIKTHLDLLSFLLKKGNLFLLLKRAEELWDTLIANPNASSFDRELGLDWFVTCVEDLNRESQIQLFQQRVSKLIPNLLSNKGYQCFKLYFDRCNSERLYQSRSYGSSSSNQSSSDILEFEGVNEVWNIVLCVRDESLANDATRFLLDLYYGKQPQRTRRTTPQILYEAFLKEFYNRLSALLSATVPTINEQQGKLFKHAAEQLLLVANNGNTSNTNKSVNIEKDFELWLQKIERILMIVEECIHMVETETSRGAHITCFQGLQYQIKIVLGELGKTISSYDVAVVHSNDTLEMLRSRLATFYKVAMNDVHISIQNTRPLPNVYEPINSINSAIALPSSNSNYPSASSSTGASNSSSNTNTGSMISTNTSVLNAWLNSKYLYEVYINPGTTIYVKLVGGTYNQTAKATNSEPAKLILKRTSPIIDDDRAAPMTPSSMMAETFKVYDVLYQLSHLNAQNIHNRIRNLLRLMPSDVRILDLLDHVSVRAANVNTNERRQSTENSINSPVPLNAQQAIQRVFNFNESTFIQLIYNLEILTSKISPLSTNIGIKQSSKLFRQDFIEKSGVEFLFKMLNSLNQHNKNEYQYALCEEMTILIIQLIELLLCGSSQESPKSPSAPTSPVALSVTEDQSEMIDFDFQATVEHLQFEEFVAQIKQLIFLCWAAAAGNIRLQEQTLAIKEQVKLDRYAMLQQINNNQFSRNNSKSSSSSDSSTNQHAVKTVQFGICVKNDSILPLDCEIAEKIIEILVFCFEKRPEYIATFLVQPFFADFLLEVLIGTTSREIRQCALRNIIRFCKIEVSTCDIRTVIHQILLKARLPLWSSSSRASRGVNQKLLAQSIEYFDLRCQLTENLSESTQKFLNINARDLLFDEFQWLSNYSVSTTSNDLRAIDNILFIGHLRFIRRLLTCSNVNKNELGENIVRLLIDQFLFPASKSMSSTMTSAATNTDMITLNDSTENSVPEPKCSTGESRLAAYEVIVELVRNTPKNLKTVVDDLINLHHRPILEKQTEWDFMPQVNPRASCGLVGLYNGGATCYMNSILQQLYMLPQISDRILSIHDDHDDQRSTEKNGNSSLFYQLQQVFGHLMESKMQYYSPESLWKVFRLWGQEINVREQQDAFDFFTALTDQIDEYLKSMKQEEIFHKQFEGIFCNQMICTNGCQHRYEGEERFMALNVAVKVDSLNESLNQFVKGELLDGNNAYFCSKCQEKRTTIKRLCIKKLPPLLCIQMKRFGFDWENNRALKFDDYFKFPLVLNMEPYTLDGVNKRESLLEHDDLVKTINGNSHKETLINSAANSSNISGSTSSNPMPTILYELTGIVIHSGQANAGHYYSFIKDTRNHQSNSSNQWYRFNDTTVEEIQLTEQMLEEECFGGTFRVNKDNINTSEERTRFWNAYMLIYQCIEPLKLLPPPTTPTVTASPSINRTMSNRTMPGSAVRVQRQTSQRDSLSQLADLVVQSEHRDLFKVEKPLIPSSVFACVKDENLEFLKNRDTYCDDYFQWIYNLCQIPFDESSLPPDMEMIEHDKEESSYEMSTRLALNFLFNTHMRTHRRLRKDSLNNWVTLLSRLFSKMSQNCLIFYQLLAERQDNGLKLYLLDCPLEDIRSTSQQICEQVLHSSFQHLASVSPQIVDSSPDDQQDIWMIESENDLKKALRSFIEQLISLLDKSVVEQVKHSQAFFQLIHFYSKLGRIACDHLVELNTLTRLTNFLLGENLESRRWTSGQAKEFGVIHEIIARLILIMREQDPAKTTESVPVLQSKWSNRYLKEICYAFQEVPTSQLTKTKELMSKLVENNQAFSEQLIRMILHSVSQAATNDLKSLFILLEQILLVEDSIEMQRLQWTFEGNNDLGSGDNNYNFNGLYFLIRTTIETEQRRAYQILKFLINLSNKSSASRDYLTSTTNQWESAINWLSQQMQTNWQTSPASNLSNEDNDIRSFRRTQSAQLTLEQAQSLLGRRASSNGNLNDDSSASDLMDCNDTQNQSTESGRN